MTQKFVSLIQAGTATAGRLALISLLMLTQISFAEEVVNIYSYRQPFLIQPMLDTFTKQTGIKTNIVFAKTGVAERLKQEGMNSPADLVLTVDIGRLQELVDAKVLQSAQSAVLNKNIPPQYRSEEGLWYGLTLRVRNIYASVDRVKSDRISYESLAKPEWQGKICTRSGKHPYNIALIASMIAHHGEAKAQQWLQGVRSNLARKPQGNDRAQVKAIKEGICDVALGNSYYYGKMLTDENQISWAQAVNILFPNQDDRGAHVNISGIALTKAAPNKKNAVLLMEFLSKDLAQRMYAEQNFEYPVKQGVSPSGLVSSWGTFQADGLSLDKISQYRKTAAKLVDKVNFDG